MKYTEDHLKQLINMLPDLARDNKIQTNKIVSQRESMKFDWRTFFDLTMDLVCVLNKELKIGKMNDFWAKELGYTSESIRGQSLVDFMHREDLEALKEAIGNIKKRGDSLSIINRLVLKDNIIRWMSWNISVTELGEEKLFIGVAKDITEYKQSVGKKLELQKNLTREKQKNLFFSTVSHEFKTPLNIILSVKQMMDKGIQMGEIIEEEEGSLKRYINLIERNSYKTLKTANNLIDLIKMDTRTVKLNYDYYNLIEVVEEITMTAIKYIEDRDIAIVFDTDIEEYFVWCDDGAIERIILNLLSNAIKFSRSNGQIMVYIKQHEKCISICVEDEGEGIVSEGETVLDVDQFIWQKSKIGLGLKIVEQLVNLHRGNMFIESKRGKGTKVGFTLPHSKCKNPITHKERGDLSIIHHEKCQVELCDI